MLLVLRASASAPPALDGSERDAGLISAMESEPTRGSWWVSWQRFEQIAGSVLLGKEEEPWLASPHPCSWDLTRRHQRRGFVVG